MNYSAYLQDSGSHDLQRLSLVKPTTEESTAQTLHFSEAQVKVRPQAPMPWLAEIVCAQQSFQQRSVPKSVLTPMAMLSSSWKGR